MRNLYQEAWLVIQEVNKAVVGKKDVIEKIMMAILAGGHILIEDMPGVGKTTMALAFSKAMGITEKRVQFTPDIMPADLTGFSVYQKETGKFLYHPGAVMCNLFLADEIGSFYDLYADGISVCGRGSRDPKAPEEWKPGGGCEECDKCRYHLEDAGRGRRSFCA